ncbi:transporter [Aureimonas endophytica]|uniref:Transporter n=1 Tax=Aureimonas endophytica TaxID=2027858 RepID=A0A916ZCZ3_9HYPH|nr:ComEC/Rec2 family competence protein [Aureimonas endophytica]GGD89328.1 transporter [Aureimonas endophytica]
MFRLARPLRRWREAEWWLWFRRQIAAEIEARTAFYLLPLAMMAGILAIDGLGWRLEPAMLLASGGAILGLTLWRIESGLARHASIFAAFACFGAASAGFELSRTETVIFSGEATVRIEGRVLWRDRDARGRLHYLVAIEATTRPTLSRPPNRAELLVSNRHAPLPVGSSYRGLVRLRAPSGPALPGGYDFAEGAFFEGIGAEGFALGPPEPAAAGENSLSLGERLIDLRLWMSDRIRDAIGGGEGAVASAIITGERTGIPREVDAWLRAAGLSHVLSISGLHMALVAGFAMTLVRLFCAAIPRLTLHLPAKKIAAGTALAISAFYLVLSGMDVATTRSFVMIAIMLVAVICDRSAVTLRNVALAALIIFATTPHALLSASFQMSFAATAAIVGGYGSFVRWRHRRAREVQDGPFVTLSLALFGIALSSTVAGLATAPYAAYHFQRIAPYGLFANLATLPLFSFWIMPLALIAVVAMPFGLDGPFLVLLGKGLTLVFAVARFLYDHLPDDPTGLVTLAGLFMLTAALLTACFLASHLRLLAIPLAVAGLISGRSAGERPDLLLFENGREAALIDTAGDLVPLHAKPNAFVLEQWRRAYPTPRGATAPSDLAFACETILEPVGPTKGETDIQKPKKPKALEYCRARTRSGLRVVWTDDYRRTGRACDEADLAIVARAIRLTTCRSGARLFTLRSLRLSGSLAIRRDPVAAGPILDAAIATTEVEWNRHRQAPWPEAWHRPATGATAANGDETP